MQCQQTMLHVAAACRNYYVASFKAADLQRVIQLLGSSTGFHIRVVDDGEIEDFQFPRKTHLNDLDHILSEFNSDYAVCHVLSPTQGAHHLIQGQIDCESHGENDCCKKYVKHGFHDGEHALDRCRDLFVVIAASFLQ